MLKLGCRCRLPGRGDRRHQLPAAVPPVLAAVPACPREPGCGRCRRMLVN